MVDLNTDLKSWTFVQYGDTFSYSEAPLSYNMSKLACNLETNLVAMGYIRLNSTNNIIQHSLQLWAQQNGEHLNTCPTPIQAYLFLQHESNVQV